MPHRIAPLLLLALIASRAARAELTVSQAMAAAVRISPTLRSAQARIEAARHAEGVARAGFLPRIELDGVDCWGFAGSSDWLGTRGLMGSPFREGIAVGIAGKQTILDFGRTLYGVETAHRLEELADSDQQVAELEVRRLALEAFYGCALEQSESDSFRRILDDARSVERQTDRFVRTGQTSIVEQSLAASQTEQARTELAGHVAAIAAARARLAVLTGIPVALIECPPLPPPPAHGGIEPDPLLLDLSGSPLVLRATRAAFVARSRLREARSENFPVISAMASTGFLADARLVEKEDYSVAVGVSLPLFEGFRIEQGVHRSESLSLASDADLDFTRQSVQEIVSRLDLTIESESARLLHLDREWTLALRAYAVAKHRYFTLRGQVVDLRDALRNLSSVVNRLDEARVRFAIARGERALILGEPVPGN